MPDKDFPDLPDENAFVFPERWRRLVHPRRDGVPGPPLRPNPGTAAEIEEILPILQGVSVDPATDPDIGAELSAYLGGVPSPRGAAAVAVVLATRNGHYAGKERDAVFANLADEWIRHHGYPFAAAAVLETPGLIASPRSGSAGFAVTVAPGPGAFTWASARLPERLRAHLAVAPAAAYESTVEHIEPLRTDVVRRLVAAYLAPGETLWVDQLCADPARGQVHQDELMLCTAGTLAQLTAIDAEINTSWALHRSARTVPTLVDALGPAAAPALAAWAEAYADTKASKRLLEALALFPTDEAFTLLLGLTTHNSAKLALIEAANRFPVRAIRLLFRAAQGTSKTARYAAQAFSRQVLARPEVAAVAELEPAARAAVDRVLTERTRLPEAVPEELPRLLTEPPWLRAGPRPEPVVLGGLTRDEPSRIRWAPGERERWSTPDSYAPERTPAEDRELAVRLAAGQVPAPHAARFLAEAPAELALPLLGGWQPEDLWRAEHWMRPVIARAELAALPVALHVARRKPQLAADLLVPFAGPEVAGEMAGWLPRLRSARPAVLRWLRRHGVAAARLLVPAALGPPGVSRSAAETALRLAADQGVDVVEAARSYGEAARAAVRALLEVDPLEVVPARVPVPGAWADPGALPQLLLRDRERALPPAAAGHVLTMLAMSRLEVPYPGVAVVAGLTDPASLARFGWAVFQAWQDAGAPGQDGWALSTLGLTGDDEVARSLTPVIRAWPGESGHGKAVTGLDVLAGIGSAVALLQLHTIAHKVRFRALRARARHKIDEVAAGLGLTAEQLADRLVPDLGLDEHGRIPLDYGRRRFYAAFDELLRPVVTDEHGRVRKALPRPGVRDDAELASAAYRRFTTLKKDVRTIVSDQVRRLEQAMIHGREWTVPEFYRLYVEHPLLGCLARRLVWFGETEDEGIRAFRIAEDRSFADLADEVIRLAADGGVRLAHPLYLGDSVAAWAELFADYEILQPFRQLGREVHRLTDAESAGGDLVRFRGAVLPTGRVFGLRRDGWQPAGPISSGVRPWVGLPVPGGRSVVLELSPGILPGGMEEIPEQTVKAVWLKEKPDEDWSRKRGPGGFGVLDPVLVSELIAGLVDLITPRSRP